MEVRQPKNIALLRTLKGLPLQLLRTRTIDYGYKPTVLRAHCKLWELAKRENDYFLNVNKIQQLPIKNGA